MRSFGIGGDGVAPLSLVAEEVDGLIRSREHDGLVGRKHGRRGLREVGNAGYGHGPGAPIDVGGEVDAEQVAAHGWPGCGQPPRGPVGEGRGRS